MKTDWKGRSLALAKEVSELRHHAENRQKDHDRHIQRLRNEGMMWKMQATALAKAMHMMTPDAYANGTVEI